MAAALSGATLWRMRARTINFLLESLKNELFQFRDFNSMSGHEFVRSETIAKENLWLYENINFYNT